MLNRVIDAYLIDFQKVPIANEEAGSMTAKRTDLEASMLHKRTHMPLVEKPSAAQDQREQFYGCDLERLDGQRKERQEQIMRAARLWFDLGLFSDHKNIDKWSLCEGMKRAAEFVSPPMKDMKCFTFIRGILGYAPELLELEPFILARKLPVKSDYMVRLWLEDERTENFEMHVLFLA